MLSRSVAGIVGRTVLVTVLLLRARLTRPLLVGMMAVTTLALPIAVLGLAPRTDLLILAFFVAGAGVETFGVGWTTSLHQHIPEAVLSRVGQLFDWLTSLIDPAIGLLLEFAGVIEGAVMVALDALAPVLDTVAAGLNAVAGLIGVAPGTTSASRSRPTSLATGLRTRCWTSIRSSPPAPIRVFAWSISPCTPTPSWRRRWPA